MLDLPPVDEFSPDNALQTEDGLEALLFSAYFEYNMGPPIRDEVLINEVTTDIGFVRVGAVEREMTPFSTLTGMSQRTIWEYFWAPRYRAIRNANALLDNIENSNVDEDFKKLVTAKLVISELLNMFTCTSILALSH